MREIFFSKGVLTFLVHEYIDTWYLIECTDNSLILFTLYCIVF